MHAYTQVGSGKRRRAVGWTLLGRYGCPKPSPPPLASRVRRTLLSHFISLSYQNGIFRGIFFRVIRCILGSWNSLNTQEFTSILPEYVASHWLGAHFSEYSKLTKNALHLKVRCIPVFCRIHIKIHRILIQSTHETGNPVAGRDNLRRISPGDEEWVSEKAG